MKFSIITTGSRAGGPFQGSELLWRDVAMVLREKGHEVEVYISKAADFENRIEGLKTAGVKVCFYGTGSHPRRSLILKIKKLMIGRKYPALPADYLPFPKGLFSTDAVLVSQAGSDEGKQLLKVLKDHEMPYFSLAQVNTEQFWPKDNEAELYREVLAGAAQNFFVSQENLNLQRIKFAYYEENCSVVWNPRNEHTPEDPISLPESGGHEISLAMVARIHPPSKGHDLVLRALSQEKWIERNIKVNIYGKGDWADTLQANIEALQLSSKVELCGYHTPEEIWRRNHALLLPSRYEGKALVMLEALWCGRPVIATDIAGASEEVVDGYNGFLASAASVKALDDALERFWRNREDVPVMSANAASRARERMASNAGEDLYREIMNALK